ncbi:MAG: NAD-dependent epimerase/dehydratase family protein [Bdellovibrionia bacterium]
MKVFVTGGNGFLGSRTVSELIQKGHTVRCLLRKESNTDRIKHLTFERHIGDICDPQSLFEGMKGCDAVVHLACISSWTDIRQLESQLETIAVGGTRNVLEAVRASGKIRAVYVSSSAAIDASKKPQVFDEKSDYTLSETSLKYSIAKHKAEQVVKQYVRDYDLDIVTVNPCEAYGPHDEGMVTAGNLVEILKESLSMVCSGGTSVAHVEDIGRGIVLALEKGRKGERYILGGDNLTIADMSRIVRKLAGKSDFVLTIPNTLIRGACFILAKLGLKTPIPVDVLDYAVLYWFVDSSKAEQELGYKWRPAQHTFKDVVQWLLDTKRVI